MGFANYAFYADTVYEDFVKKICPKEYSNFAKELERLDLSFDEFCDYITNEKDLFLEELDETNLDFAYSNMQKAFEDKTGLQLDVTYHESSDQGDEIDGGVFIVDGVYTMTSNGEKYKQEIHRKFWTDFG